MHMGRRFQKNFGLQNNVLLVFKRFHNSFLTVINRELQFENNFENFKLVLTI